MIVITKSREEHAKVKNIFNKYGIKKESEETFIVYNKDFDYTKYKYLSIFTYEQFLKVAEHLLSTGEDLSLNSKKLDSNGGYVVCFYGDYSGYIPSNYIFKTNHNNFINYNFIKDINGNEKGWGRYNPLYFRLATEEEKQMFIKAGKPVDVSKTEPIKIPTMSLYGTCGKFIVDKDYDFILGDSIDNGSINVTFKNLGKYDGDYNLPIVEMSNGFLVTGSKTATANSQTNKFPLIKSNDDNNTNDIPLLNLKKITKLNLIN